MNQQDRLTNILKMLEKRSKITQEELMLTFSISKDTARRDILKLVGDGLVERFPGGISRPILKAQIETYSNRLVKHSREKQEIAHEASRLIDSEMTIYLDVSTTVNFLAAGLEEMKLVIVTNSMDNALSVTEKNKNKVYLLGGFFDPDSRLLKGDTVVQQIKQFNFDWAFIGGAGLTEQGIFYSELSDISLKQEIINNARKVCVLIDSSKMAQQTAYKIDFSGIDLIVTDQPFSENLMKKLNEQEVEVIITKGHK